MGMSIYGGMSVKRVNKVIVRATSAVSRNSRQRCWWRASPLFERDTDWADDTGVRKQNDSQDFTRRLKYRNYSK